MQALYIEMAESVVNKYRILENVVFFTESFLIILLY